MRGGKFGWVIEEMFATQGEQFLYLLASELLEREVMKPWAIQQGGAIAKPRIVTVHGADELQLRW